jgi:hypothetical protein
VRFATRGVDLLRHLLDIRAGSSGQEDLRTFGCELDRHGGADGAAGSEHDRLSALK